MPRIIKSRTYSASPEAVWDLLADFPNISRWNSGVKHSESTTSAASGVGAQRHCDLAPFGALEETIREWDEGKMLAISIDKAKLLPIKQGLVKFAISPDGEGSKLDFDYEYDLKFGPLGKLMQPLLKGQLDKGFDGFLDDIGTAVSA